jgi:hypothetical protein
VIFNDLWSFDLEKKKWTKIKSLRDPQPRFDHLVYTVDNYMYILGGTGEQHKPVKDIWRFDTQWTQIFLKSSFDQISTIESYLPATGGSGIAFGSKFVIYGGETRVKDNKEVDPYLMDFLIFDHEKMILSRSGDIQPTPLSCHQLIWNGDRILAVGGISSKGSFFNSFNQIISFPIENTFLESFLLKGKIFETTVDEIMNLSKQGNKIPTILDQCIIYLEKNGIIEGIFRKSGRYSDLVNISLMFENEMVVNLDSIDDPHVVAGVLKRFLNSVQDPILTFELHHDFISCTDEQQVISVLKNLSPLHYQISKRLFHLLCEIDKHQDKTFMTWENIQIIMGSAFLRSKTPQQGNLDKTQVLRLLITKYDKIFE